MGEGWLSIPCRIKKDIELAWLLVPNKDTVSAKNMVFSCIYYMYGHMTVGYLSKFLGVSRVTLHNNLNRHREKYNQSTVYRKNYDDLWKKLDSTEWQ